MKNSRTFLQGPGFLRIACILLKLSLIWHVWQCVGCNTVTKAKSSSSKEDKGMDAEEMLRARAITLEMLGIRGMASSGMSNDEFSKTVPKCLDRDMRMEKVTQVTQHCEKVTGENTDGYETDPPTGKSLCFTACMWKFLGLVGDDLMFTSNIETFVIDLFPPAAHGQVKRAVRACAKSSVLPLSKENNCTSFGAVKGCLLRSVQNICDGNDD